MLYQFQSYNKVMQLYIYKYPFFLRFFAHMHNYRTWSRSPALCRRPLLVVSFIYSSRYVGLPGGSEGKESACNSETQVQSLGPEDPSEKGMETHSNIFAWKIRRTEEPGGLQSTGSQEQDTTERLTLASSVFVLIKLLTYPSAVFPFG